MTILLFGKRGQLGRELESRFQSLDELIALDKYSSDYCGDFTNLDGIARTIRDLKPDFVVNASAYTKVDDAENNLELASLINAHATGVIARETDKYGGKLIHFSTDYVFDGSGSYFRREDAKAIPLNVYGRTKLLGEKAIVNSGQNSIIFRTSWICSKHKGNFLTDIIDLATTEPSMDVVVDQVGVPTSTTLIADITCLCLGRLRADANSLNGIYHLVSAGETSRYDYAKYILKIARELGASIGITDDKVFPTSSALCPIGAPRPLNSRLDTKKLRDTLCITLPPWQEGVREIVTTAVKGDAIDISYS